MITQKNEVLRIEQGMIRSKDGYEMKDLYLYAFSGEKIGITYSNPVIAEIIRDVLIGENALKEGVVFINEELMLGYDVQNKLRDISFVISEKSRLNQFLSFWENFQILTESNEILIRNRYRYVSEILEEMKEFTVPFSLFDHVSDLTPLQVRIAELLMAYVRKMKIVVIFNPNNYLTPEESRILTAYIHLMSQKGMTFFIFDHDIEYLKYVSDTIFVLKHGRTVARLKKNEYSNLDIYLHLAEKDHFSLHFEKHLKEQRQTILSLHKVQTDNLFDLSMELYPGEMLVVNCSKYKEYYDFRRLLFHGMKPERGVILYRERLYAAKNMTEAISNGLYMLEENSGISMLDSQMDNLSNCYFEIMHKAKVPVIPNRYYFSAIRTLEEHFEPEQLLEIPDDLTKAQKKELVLCKILLHMPKLLVCMNPFAYAEADEVRMIKNMLRELQRSNCAVLILALTETDLSGLDVRKGYIQQGRLRE